MTRYAVDIGSTRWGVEKSSVVIEGKLYLTRWILYWGFGTLRLHKFYRGDDDRASHTHPWWFITFPLGSYFEEVFHHGWSVDHRVVRAFRPHFRGADFEHVVHGGATRHGCGFWYYSCKPFYTIVLTGRRQNDWGFYPDPEHFIPWEDYK